MIFSCVKVRESRGTKTQRDVNPISRLKNSHDSISYSNYQTVLQSGEHRQGNFPASIESVSSIRLSREVSLHPRPSGRLRSSPWRASLQSTGGLVPASVLLADFCQRNQFNQPTLSEFSAQRIVTECLQSLCEDNSISDPLPLM